MNDRGPFESRGGRSTNKVTYFIGQIMQKYVMRYRPSLVTALTPRKIFTISYTPVG
jgi:hypothetical protein